jgi:uncharacterized YigZ family protein
MEINNYTYYTILNKSTAEFKDRGSKFISYCNSIASIDEAKLFLKEIKLLHPKATHHCYAYRLGLNKDIFRAVDDGEPSGSAGKPILNAIDSEEITNTIVVVVRYYGGTLLGVPGLINAYRLSAKNCLENAGKLLQEQMAYFELEFDYLLSGTINQNLNLLNAKHSSTENLLFCKKRVGIPLSKLSEAEVCFANIHGLIYKKLQAV